MPFKHNAAHRHRISKMKIKVTNWGRIRSWPSPARQPDALDNSRSAVILAPKRTTLGGRRRYSDLAIETALTLGVVFGLHLRQTEGLLVSALKLMGLDLAVPDHTTLSRRARTWRSANRARSPWRRPVADGEVRGQIPSGLAQTAPGAGRRHRRNHHRKHDRSECGRRLTGRTAAQ